MNLRTFVIQKLIHLNENIFFYPKLKKFYKEILLDKLNENIHILDVGTNKGQSIDFFLNINQKLEITGFEPNRKLYQTLLKKYAAKKNVNIKNVGVSNKKGVLTFNENVLDETSTFEELNYDSEYLKKKARVLGVKPKDIISASYDVEVITLSEIVDRLTNVSEVLLKIDVEGHEFQCLQGLFTSTNKHKIKYIQLENHNDDMYASRIPFSEISKLLETNGFSTFKIIKHGFGDFEEVIFKNIV